MIDYFSLSYNDIKNKMTLSSDLNLKKVNLRDVGHLQKSG